MKDERKTRSQLIDELTVMRKRVAALERKLAIAAPSESQALRESEERLRLALDAANDGLWDWNPGTGRTYFSPRYYTMLGYEANDFSPTYESWRQLVHPEDLASAEGAIRRALKDHTPFTIEFRMKAKNGAWRWILGRGKVVELDTEGKAVRVVGAHTDITDHKRTAEALENRIVALTRPLEDVESIAFEDLFNLSDIQYLQDLYAEVFGVAALITRPDGTPITQPSNFTTLCSQFIRSTEKGSRNCNISDAMVGRYNPDGPNIQPCLSAGLCNAGACITVGGRHIANWLIGQVRNENQKEEEIMAYARELGADESAFRAAYRQVPIMSQEQFERVARVLFTVANQLSTSAYQNVQQARFIAEKKRAEESLRLTQFIFDEAPIGIWRMGTKGEVLDVNEHGCASLGYTREELCRMTVFDFAPGFDIEAWKIGTQKLNETGSKTTEAFHQCRSGEIYPVQVLEKMLRYEGQESRLAFVQDISERKRNEESLRMARFIIDNANIGIYRIAPEGRIVEVNRKAAQLLGYKKEELEALSMSDIDPRVARDSWRLHWQRLNAQRSRKFEREHRRKDGSTIAVEVNSNLLEYEGREYAIAFVQDITQRKQDEKELHRLRNYLSNIIDSMPSVLVGVDSQGRVTQWNRQAERVTGISEAGARSRHLGAVFPRLAVEMDTIKTAIRKRRVISDPRVPRQLKHEVRYEDVTVYPLVTNGVAGAVIRVDDVTQKVRLDEMMIQSEKMLSVGGLAAGMAHEINNPLAGILQNASVLTNRLTGDLPANHRAAEAAGTTMEAIRNYLELRKLPGMIENIRASGSRAASIVKNMLSFARKSDKVVSSQDLSRLLDQTLELVRTDYDMKKQYDFKQIELVREYDDAAVTVPCEASKIQQVFMNILKNGAEAMAGVPDAPAAPAFVLRVRNDGDWVQVEIEDNGPGMSDATRRRIFEPFFTTKPVGQGTGLGLSVSYFIITEDHGGEMRVHAAEGGGTRFVIRLPR